MCFGIYISTHTREHTAATESTYKKRTDSPLHNIISHRRGFINKQNVLALFAFIVNAALVYSSSIIVIILRTSICATVQNHIGIETFLLHKMCTTVCTFKWYAKWQLNLVRWRAFRPAKCSRAVQNTLTHTHICIFTSMHICIRMLMAGRQDTFALMFMSQVRQSTLAHPLLGIMVRHTRQWRAAAASLATFLYHFLWSFLFNIYATCEHLCTRLHHMYLCALHT